MGQPVLAHMGEEWRGGRWHPTAYWSDPISEVEPAQWLLEDSGKMAKQCLPRANQPSRGGTKELASLQAQGLQRAAWKVPGLESISFTESHPPRYSQRQACP